MSLTAGGGQSWVVGKLWLSAESAAVAPVRARAGARRGARTVRIGVAWPVEVRARAAGLVAHRADLDARRIREQVAVEEDLRVERQAEARGAAGAVGRAAG